MLGSAVSTKQGDAVEIRKRTRSLRFPRLRSTIIGWNPKADELLKYWMLGVTG